MRAEIEKGPYQGIASAMPSAPEKLIPALAAAEPTVTFMIGGAS